MPAPLSSFFGYDDSVSGPMFRRGRALLQQRRRPPMSNRRWQHPAFDEDDEGELGAYMEGDELGAAADAAVCSGISDDLAAMEEADAEDFGGEDFGEDFGASDRKVGRLEAKVSEARRKVSELEGKLSAARTRWGRNRITRHLSRARRILADRERKLSAAQARTGSGTAAAALAAGGAGAAGGALAARMAAGAVPSSPQSLSRGGAQQVAAGKRVAGAETGLGARYLASAPGGGSVSLPLRAVADGAVVQRMSFAPAAGARDQAFSLQSAVIPYASFVLTGYEVLLQLNGSGPPSELLLNGFLALFGVSGGLNELYDTRTPFFSSMSGGGLQSAGGQWTQAFKAVSSSLRSNPLLSRQNVIDCAGVIRQELTTTVVFEVAFQVVALGTVVEDDFLS